MEWGDIFYQAFLFHASKYILTRYFWNIYGIVIWKLKKKISWKRRTTKIRMLVQKWFQPIADLHNFHQKSKLSKYESKYFRFSPGTIFHRLVILDFSKTIGILIDSFKAGAWLGNKIRAICDSDDNDGGRGNLYVGRGYGYITEASIVGGEENAFNV